MLAKTFQVTTFFCLVPILLAKCPIGTTNGPSNPHCYLYRTAATSWLAAEQDCVNRKGHLASVHDTLTNKFLSSIAGGCASEVWLGGESFVQEAWSWTDGTRWQYTDWPSGHHSATGPQCLMLNATDTMWYGESCTVQKPYVCKMPPLPEPPTTTPSPPLCPESWTISPVTGKCYKLVGYDTSYQAALTFCSSAGANLPSIHSDADNAWFSTFALINGDSGWIFLGLARASGSTWKWSDGSAYDYQNWDGRSTSGDQNYYALVYNLFNSSGGESFGMWRAWTVGAPAASTICQLLPTQ